jgi:hypothetical protein
MLRQPAALTFLDLQQNRLSGVALGGLVESPGVERLTHLNLGDNVRIGADGAWGVARSPNLSALRSLNLSVTGIGNMGLQSLADSEHLRSLSRLHLGGNEIGDAGIRVLASSELLPRLEVLTLRDNYLTRDGVEALAASAGVGRLRLLDVRNNRLEGEGVETLLASPHFAPGTRLRVFQGNGVSTKFMETLRRAHAGHLVLD